MDRRREISPGHNTQTELYFSMVFSIKFSNGWTVKESFGNESLAAVWITYSLRLVVVCVYGAPTYRHLVHCCDYKTTYQYRKSHCGDKTVVRSSYLHNGITYTGKAVSLYWIGSQLLSSAVHHPTHYGCWAKVLTYRYPQHIVLHVTAVVTKRPGWRMTEDNGSTWPL